MSISCLRRGASTRARVSLRAQLLPALEALFEEVGLAQHVGALHAKGFESESASD